MMGEHRLKRLKTGGWQRGATQLGFLDVLTAVVVLAILVYAASRQFPTYRNFKSPAAEQSQPH
jgi:hypothetical protein